ncbi:MAG: hypothetical protein OXI32_07445 [bacterium]|nr:hypothetical protein [bacterium]
MSENAFVYGNAEVSDTAQVFGNALVFGTARVLDGAMVYDRVEVYGNAIVFDRAESVFDGDDPARQFWNDSYDAADQFAGCASFIRCAFLGGDCEGVPEFHFDVGRENSRFAEQFKSTHAFGDAKVFGNARVWGGSRLFGIARVRDEARISGGSYYFAGEIYGDAWINSTRRRYISAYC